MKLPLKATKKVHQEITDADDSFIAETADNTTRDEIIKCVNAYYEQQQIIGELFKALKQAVQFHGDTCTSAASGDGWFDVKTAREALAKAQTINKQTGK